MPRQRIRYFSLTDFPFLIMIIQAFSRHKIPRSCLVYLGCTVCSICIRPFLSLNQSELALRIASYLAIITLKLVPWSLTPSPLVRCSFAKKSGDALRARDVLRSECTQWILGAYFLSTGSNQSIDLKCRAGPTIDIGFIYNGFAP